METPLPGEVPEKACYDYYNVPALHATAIGTLSYDSLLFHNRREGLEKGKSTKALNFGTAVHTYILEKDEFFKRYEVLNCKLPSEKQQELIDKVGGFNDQVNNSMRPLEVFYTIYAGSAAKDPEKKRNSDVTKVTEIFKENKEYIEFHKNLQDSGKTLLSVDDMDKIYDMEQAFNESECRQFISGKQGGYACNEEGKYQINVAAKAKVFYELEIHWTFAETYGESELKYLAETLPEFDQHESCKSKIDVLIISGDTVYVVDLKTTGKPIQVFAESYEKYNYHRQACFYNQAVKCYLKRRGLDYTRLKFINVIIPIESNAPHRTCLALAANKDVNEKGFAEIISLLRTYSIHKSRKDWQTPAEVLKNGFLSLKLGD